MIIINNKRILNITGKVEFCVAETAVQTMRGI